MKSKLLLGSGALLIAAIILLAAAPGKNSADAARLNNLGCAYMNQQLFEKALKYFEDASAADPNLHVAKINQGIALLSLARVDPAKKILEEAAKEDPNDPHVWYALGMLEKTAAIRRPLSTISNASLQSTTAILTPGISWARFIHSSNNFPRPSTPSTTR